MLSVAVFTIACGFAALSVGASLAFSIWLRWQTVRLGRLQEVHSRTATDPLSRALLPGHAPEAVVILCVRGHDPFLADTIRALARQDYANYRLLIVVDHQLDPAWRVVTQVKQELGLNGSQLELQELEQRHERCGLKCSALLQALESLSTSTTTDRVIVTVDSDAIPEPSWLMHLLQPMVDESVGATTSNQWFEPRSWALGSWVRAVWQAGAIVPTAMLSNPWAGSFAIRHSDILSSGLMDDWRTSIIDDGPVRENLQQLGKRIEFVPQNVVINREDCSLAFCFRYVTRMLTWSRLFESTFWITGLHAGVTATIQAFVALWCVYELWGIGSYETLAIGSSRLILPVSAAALLLLSQVLGYWIVRNAILNHSKAARQAHNNRTNVTNSVPWVARMLLVTLAVPMATTAYVFGCIRATRVKKVVWRNIAYQVEGGRRVKMLDYSPFASEASSAYENHSV
jgi:glycosyltransferase involved in cell wall biosynthesis